MARERGRRNITVSGAVIRLLERVGNGSRYIDLVVEQHAREWTEALALLLSNGWRSSELLAVCDALAGYGLAGVARGGHFIAEELTQSLERENTFRKRDVPPLRAQQCVRQIAAEPAIAYAMSTLVREFWLGNEACSSAVRQARGQFARKSGG